MCPCPQHRIYLFRPIPATEKDGTPVPALPPILWPGNPSRHSPSSRTWYNTFPLHLHNMHSIWLLFMPCRMFPNNLRDRDRDRHILPEVLPGVGRHPTRQPSSPYPIPPAKLTAMCLAVKTVSHAVGQTPHPTSNCVLHAFSPKLSPKYSPFPACCMPFLPPPSLYHTLCCRGGTCLSSLSPPLLLLLFL